METKTKIAERLRKRLSGVEIYLPSSYAETIFGRLNEVYALGTIKQVKSGSRQNIQILTALIELAQEEKEKVSNVLKPAEK